MNAGDSDPDEKTALTPILQASPQEQKRQMMADLKSPARKSVQVGLNALNGFAGHRLEFRSRVENVQQQMRVLGLKL